MHHDSLQDALRQLPQHQAPDFIWERIEAQLAADESLYQAIAALPTYGAPDRVWGRIERGLERRNAIRRMLRSSWSAAAGVAILLTASIGLYQWKQNQAAVSYAYRQELAPSPHVSNDWDAAEADVQEVLNLYSHFCKYQAQNEADCNLDRELQELNEAKAELEAVMARYGEDPDLIRQLGELELDRSRVVKAMVDKIQTS